MPVAKGFSFFSGCSFSCAGAETADVRRAKMSSDEVRLRFDKTESPFR
jgi:hypothetical protein